MRLLCRLGIHKWGAWSQPWATKSALYNGDPIEVEMRSLKCSCCGWRKDRVFKEWKKSNISAGKPVWENSNG